MEFQEYLAPSSKESLLKAADEEALADGRMKLTTVREAREQYQERLSVAGRSVVEEPNGKKRIVYNASDFVRLNHRTRIKDYVAHPGPGDSKAVLEEMEDETRETHCSWITVVWDLRLGPASRHR